MTGFRTAPAPEKTDDENGDRVGALGGQTGRRALSEETTVELHSDSEYSDSISGKRKRARQPGRDD